MFASTYSASLVRHTSDVTPSRSFVSVSLHALHTNAHWKSESWSSLRRIRSSTPAGRCSRPTLDVDVDGAASSPLSSSPLFRSARGLRLRLGAMRSEGGAVHNSIVAANRDSRTDQENI